MKRLCAVWVVAEVQCEHKTDGSAPITSNSGEMLRVPCVLDWEADATSFRISLLSLSLCRWVCTPNPLHTLGNGARHLCHHMIGNCQM